MLALLKVGVQITYLKKKKKNKKKPNETKPNPPKLNQTIKKWYMILSENFFLKKKNSYQCI
jgi:hypothetical protein